jgi:hypothetical protein
MLREGGGALNWDRHWIATVLTAQVAAGAALRIAAQVFLVWVIIGYLMPFFGLEFLDMARDVAAGEHFVSSQQAVENSQESLQTQEGGACAWFLCQRSPQLYARLPSGHLGYEPGRYRAALLKIRGASGYSSWGFRRTSKVAIGYRVMKRSETTAVVVRNFSGSGAFWPSVAPT